MLVRTPAPYSSLDDANIGYGADNAQLGILRLLRWNTRLIAACIVVTLMVAAVALAVLPPRYKATTVVLVDPRQARVTNSESVLPGIGADAAAVESQVELIESSALARKVISKLNLAQDPYFARSSLVETLVGLVWHDSNADREDVRLNRLVHRFQSGLVVRRRGLTYVLEISYFAPQAARAAEISRAVADAYLDDQQSTKLEATIRASSWLTERIEGLRDQVRIAERAVADYRAAHGIVDVTQGNKLISRQVEDLTQQLALARSRTADAKARLERAEQVARRATDPAELSEALQSTVIANLRSQYAEAARLQAEYSALVGERHPSLIAVRSQLVGIRRQIDQELARIVAAMRNDYSVAEARERSLEQELDGLVERSAAATHADVRYHELEREAQASRTLLEQFLSRARETKEQQSLQMTDARIISPALVPLRQTRPPAPILLIIAAFGGGILGVGFVLIKEQTRRGLRSRAEVASALSLPCLASLPAEVDGSGQTLFPATSIYVASLHSIRKHLRSRATGTRGQVVAVISALPHEGKSTFACNFAMAAACSGINTLLIDGDVFDPSASRTFNASGPGLLDIVGRRATAFGGISKYVGGRLAVLGARDGSTALSEPPDVPEHAFARLLDDGRAQFDLIVIDTPAILPPAGNLPFIECCDDALLIVEWEKTEREASREALAALGPHADKVAGAILNKVPLKWHQLFERGKYQTYPQGDVANLLRRFEEPAPRREPPDFAPSTRQGRSSRQLFRL